MCKNISSINKKYQVNIIMASISHDEKKEINESSASSISSRMISILKSTDEIRDTVCLNVMKMLSHRVLQNSKTFIDKKNITDHANALITDIKQSRVHEIKSDNDAKLKYIINYIPYKVKSSELVNFYTEHKGTHKIVILDNENEKSAKQFNTAQDTEIFFINQLMINLIEHISVPAVRVLTPDEIKQCEESYNLKKSQFPIIYSSDPLSKYYNLKPGQVIRLVRPSSIAGYGVAYRMVVRK